ncbi:MAG: DUF3857 domain-containing protein [Flavisolibacter sp.]
MRKLTAVAIAIALSFPSIAQKNKNKDPNLPAFGTVDKSDLEMKQCDFDDKAEAMVLIDDGVLAWGGSDLEFKRRVRIKVFNNKGVDWADIHLRYKSEKNDEDITGIEAETYNLDANGAVTVSKVDKKLIYEKKINKKYSEKVFTFPDVKPGSVIEYKFKHRGVGLVDWYFQRSIPVKYSHFVIDFPSELEIAVVPFCAHDLQSDKKQDATNTISTYSMANVPALRDEPYIINEDFYRDRLETKLAAYTINGMRKSRIVSWVDVIKALMEDEDFGVQLKKNIPRTADLDAKLKTISSPYEKMKTIYKYVQDNMQWNEYLGIWASDGVKSAWKDKKGTVGEINLILVNLLRDADLNAHPLLVSTHDNGIVNTLDAGTYESPGYRQFDKVMAYVTIDDKHYVLDATEKTTPVHLIPPDVLLTQGLVIEKIDTYDWGWKELWNDNILAKNTIILKGVIDENGSMKGSASITSFDYARQNREAVVKKGKDKYIENYVKASNPTMAVQDVSFDNTESDSLPLVQKIEFTEPLASTGDYNYFSVNMLTGLEKNPFVADQRSSDVFFGYNQSFDIIGNFQVPEGYEFSELPKNIKMIMPDTSISISRISQVTNGNLLQTRVRIDFTRPYYPADQYEQLHEFYQRLFDILNEQFVYGKKKK